MPHRLPTHQYLPEEAAFLNFRTLVDGMPTPYMVMDARLVIVYANLAYLDSVERALEDIVGRYIFDAFPDTEERIKGVREKFLNVLNGRTTHLDVQNYQHVHADGRVSTKTWQCVQTPYYGPDGRVIYIVQHADDITEASMLRSKNELISRELDHRVKNMFSVVMAVANLASHGAEDVQTFREEFCARIMSMDRTHAALQNVSWAGLSLHSILESELQQYGGPGSSRISTGGPRIQLNARTSQDCSLFIHELATNAAKYGCFSQPGGQLAVSWALDTATERLEIVWQETGLQGVSAPDHAGFGTQLGDFIPDMEVQRTYHDTGLEVRISLPRSVLGDS
ncbi:HWE histidine kinase domain-containing protein [Henriciella sp.]|uniref:HWE histidine kinase domain-containing protein n=1 Tax=Henriciella sp. TaxID=1968823 RepID=UPI00260B7641|nr:HWE histidine kinase domain-containing protein [Henriciella sp.]